MVKGTIQGIIVAFISMIKVPFIKLFSYDKCLGVDELSETSQGTQ